MEQALTKLRPLVMDDKAKAEVARVKAYAEAHHYRPPSKFTPGDNPKFVARLNTYRAVFTYTHSNGVVYRDLSVSVPSKKLPNPAAVWAIADMFGFTGYDIEKLSEPGADWMLHHSKKEHCIRVCQALGGDGTVKPN